MTSGSRKQGGTTLIIALIMLVLLTLFAVSSFNTANTNLKVVGNMQQKSEALNAAQEAIGCVSQLAVCVSRRRSPRRTVSTRWS